MKKVFGAEEDLRGPRDRVCTAQYLLSRDRYLGSVKQYFGSVKTKNPRWLAGGGGEVGGVN